MNETDLVLHVDQEHRALQAAIIIGFFLSALVSYWIIQTIISSAGINLIAAALALVIGFLVSKGMEAWLKGRWRSGRRLYLSADRFYTQKGRRTEHEIDANEDFDLLFWRFTVKRAGRIPKGWYLLSCAFHQSGNYLPVYSFMSAEEFDNFPQSERFVELAPKKNIAADDNFQLVGLQKRLHTAEVFRWNEGAELSKDDFRSFMARLMQQFPSRGN
ncbi:MAG: hypothetical protein OXF22_02005 [Anaerolineaceae bacterium]|nr:hypothetical protein [Anaerolineaceae bacterium]